MKYDYHEEYNLRFQEGIINLILLKINREDLNKQIVLYKNEICRKCNAIKIITICLLGMICTLFTGQTGKEGIFMRYSYEYKRNCIELYRQGKWPETPKGIKERNFRIMIGRWVRIEKYQGPEALRHKNFNKIWTPEEKLELISQVLAGKSNQEVALSAGISGGMLYQWVQKYKSKGYNGLVDMKKGRPPKEPQMKKNVQPAPLTESEREELIRLRAENEYIKAENEVIKKRIALRQEKEAARLKAKKQRSSKNSVKKDIN